MRAASDAAGRTDCQSVPENSATRTDRSDHQDCDAAHAGQAVYSPRVLAIYDWLVLGLSNRLIWRCPTWHLERLYRDHLTANHLDVGVGTGYFLDRSPVPASSPRVALMDLNATCLAAAAERIKRYEPEQYQRNILEPIAFEGTPFDSIGLNYVLHCLPGTMGEKAVVFDHLRPLLVPGGVLFGSTLLSDGVPRNVMARWLSAKYNQKGIFGNATDSLESLRSALDARFTTWQVETVGCAALFWGR